MNRSISAALAVVSALAFGACANADDVFSDGEQAEAVETDSVLPPSEDNLNDLPSGPTTPGEEPGLGLPPDTAQCPGPIDFESDGNGMALVAGQPITALPGVGVSAVLCTNNDPAHPNTCIIFDSANPSGGDTDLGTPNETFGGPGVGLGGEAGQVGANDTSEDNILIIAENVHDCELDSLVDDPDDEAAGGTIEMVFAEVSTVNDITLLDIDANEASSVEVMLDGGGTVSFSLAMLGNNSKQTVAIGVSGAIGIKVHFSASGGLASLDICPDSVEEPECVEDADCGDTDLYGCNDNGECVDLPGAIGGMAFFDNNGNGVFDGLPGDAAFSGTAVDLYYDDDNGGLGDGFGDGAPVASTSTDAAGAYSFSGLDTSHNYVVAFQDWSIYSYSWTTPNIGDDTLDSDMLPSTGFTATISLVAGEEKGDISCGYVPPGIVPVGN